MARAAFAGIAALTFLLPVACAVSGRVREPQEPGQRNANSLTVVAEIALERGDCRTASESYAEAALQGTAALARRASEVALACEHLPSAWRAAQRWYSLAPADHDAIAIYSTVALKLHRVPDASAAIARLLRTPGPETDTSLAELAGVLLEEADGPAVLAAVGGAVDTDSASADVLALLAELALKGFHLQRAEQLAAAALARDAGSVAARRVLARVYVLRGEGERAIALAREVMQSDPGENAFELADVLVGLERLEEARSELERLRARDVPPADIERRLALMALQGGDFSEAERRFAELAASGEAGEAALFYLADIAERGGDKETALAGYRRLADSALGLAARTRAAAILLERRDRAEALTLLDDYASQYPELVFELTLAKAQLLAEHGDAEGGLALLDTALERHPQHPTLQYERAVVLERGGRVRESVEAFERLLGERPEDPLLMNALGYTLADHGLELPRAESLIRRALTTTPDNPAVLDSLGWARFRRGDARGAVPILARAYGLGPDPEIAAHWGEALWASGDQQQARRVWAAALARDPGSRPIKATLTRLLPPERQ